MDFLCLSQGVGGCCLSSLPKGSTKTSAPWRWDERIPGSHCHNVECECISLKARYTLLFLDFATQGPGHDFPLQYKHVSQELGNSLWSSFFFFFLFV